MSIRTAKEVACDGCLESVRLDSKTVNEDWPLIARDGWTRKNGFHWCPECSKDKK